MRKIFSIMLAVLIGLLYIQSVFAEDVKTEDSDFTGIWWFGSTGRGSSYAIASEVVFNEDHTIDFIYDPDSTGTWEAVNGRMIITCTTDAIGTGYLNMKFDEEKEMYTEDVGIIVYTLSRNNPIPELNVEIKEDATLADYAGEWVPYRLFVSGTEMSVKDVLADDLKIKIEDAYAVDITSGEITEEHIPSVRIFQDADIDDPVDEHVEVSMENSLIKYAVYDYEYLTDDMPTGEHPELVNKTMKYSGEMKYRVDGKIEMTMNYDVVSLIIVLVKPELLTQRTVD